MEYRCRTSCPFIVNDDLKTMPYPNPDASIYVAFLKFLVEQKGIFISPSTVAKC
jgi:hypothetical protein